MRLMTKELKDCFTSYGAGMSTLLVIAGRIGKSFRYYFRLGE
jgi:hypothetical protein